MNDFKTNPSNQNNDQDQKNNESDVEIKESSTSSVKITETNSNSPMKNTKNSNEKWLKHKLFGGALNICLPERFHDLSNFRQIPDSQEVYSDANTDQSLIIELLEMVTNVKDEKAAQYHFQVISDANSSINTQIVNKGTFSNNSHLQDSNTNGNADDKYCSWIAGTQCVSKGRDSKEKSNFVAVFLLLIRLKEWTTDLVINFNSPINIHPDSQAKNCEIIHQNPEMSMQLFQKITQTLCLKNIHQLFNVQDEG